MLILAKYLLLDKYVKIAMWLQVIALQTPYDKPIVPARRSAMQVLIAIRRLGTWLSQWNRPAEPQHEPHAGDGSSGEEGDEPEEGEGSGESEIDVGAEESSHSENETEILHTFITETAQHGLAHPLPIVQGPFYRDGEEIANLGLTDRIFYVVWVIPGRPDLQGIHYGGNAWPGLQERFPGRRYSYPEGIRLRSRVAGPTSPRMTWNEAVVAFFREVDGHNTRVGWPMVNWFWLFRWP